MTETGGGARTHPRRRGAALEQALYQAVLEELADTGYGALTMEAIAKRARTGKAALYRRWPSKRQLVLDALLQVLPDPVEIAPSRSVRARLVAALTIMSDILAGHGAYPGLHVLAEVWREPELRTAFAGRVIEPRLSLIQDLLRQAGDSGEVNPEAAIPMIARTGPALVIQTYLLTGRPPSRAELIRIVDTILMPLLTRE